MSSQTITGQLRGSSQCHTVSPISIPWYGVLLVLVLLEFLQEVSKVSNWITFLHVLYFESSLKEYRTVTTTQKSRVKTSLQIKYYVNIFFILSRITNKHDEQRTIQEEGVFNGDYLIRIRLLRKTL